MTEESHGLGATAERRKEKKGSMSSSRLGRQNRDLLTHKDVIGQKLRAERIKGPYKCILVNLQGR